MLNTSFFTYLKKYMWTSACAGVILSILIGCGSGPRKQYSSKAEEIYDQGLIALEAEDFLAADQFFQTVKLKFAYTPYAPLAEVRLGDVLFVQGRYIEAISLYQFFIKSRPNHREVPYAYWKISEGYFKQIPSDFFILPPPHERDQGSTKDALRALKTYTARYPQHQYAQEADKYIQVCRKRLAAHELYVAQFYTRLGQDQAALSRYEYLSQNFKDTPSYWNQAYTALKAIYKKQGKKEQLEALEQMKRYLKKIK